MNMQKRSVTHRGGLAGTRNQMGRWACLLIVGIVAGFLLAACGSPESAPTPTALSPKPTASVPGLRSIALEAYRDGTAEIYVMNPDGSKQTRVTKNP